MSTKRKGAPSCGLWLRIGPDLVLDMLVKDLKQIFFTINGSAYEKNMHALEITGDATDDEFRKNAGLLFAMAAASGVATIYRGPAQAAKDLGAEGVILDQAEDVAAAQELFGEDGIIGVACGLSQETSLAAYDEGVDFVSFGTADKTPAADVFKMWTVLTDKPAVIEGPVTNDYCAYYVQAGAGFIDATEYVFTHEKGVMQGTVNMLHAIDLALEEQGYKIN